MTTQEGKAQSIIQTLVAIEPGDTSTGFKRITSEQGDAIARLFDGDFELFRKLDEQPGLYTSPFYHGVEGDYSYDSWHYKLRQARNDASNMFFEILASDRREREERERKAAAKPPTATVNGSVMKTSAGYECCLWIEVDGAQIDGEVYGYGRHPSDAIACAAEEIDYSPIS